jgi:transcriptional regulator CBF1
VQYIHHLKENEARNIEKWTLEKLLMDQAMGDLQAQLEEVKRLWDEERTGRQRLESELEHLRGRQQGGQEEGGAANAANAGAAVTGTKRRNEGEVDGGVGENPDTDRDGKRQRVE